MTARIEFAENFGRSRGEKPKLASPAHEPVAQKPAAPKLAAQEPASPAHEPVAQEPAAPKLAAQEPASPAHEPVPQEPAAPKPAAQEPAAPKPTAQEHPVLEPTDTSGGRGAGSAEHESRSPYDWGQDIGVVLKRVESSLPGSVPVALGAGALALAGVLDWPVAVGGVGLYAAIQWLRFGSPIEQ